MRGEVGLVREVGLRARTIGGVASHQDGIERRTRRGHVIAEVRHGVLIVEQVVRRAQGVGQREVRIEVVLVAYRADVVLRRYGIRYEAVIGAARHRRGTAVHEGDARVGTIVFLLV